MNTCPPEDLDLVQQAIDDAIEVLHGRDPAPPGPYSVALTMWCSTLLNVCDSREDAIEALREVAAGCQVARLELADQT